ncbi:MAG: sigma-70 family RNA polymerase sigma factor [Dehalococcoidales bacterium]|nr:sigma-70 family RNA polymerase sigma factor [Dehalococcoidales bacterium]
MQDEENLVRRAQQHDEEAFAQLYEEYFDKIYRYIAIRIGDRMEAEDMTQQVFLKAIRAIASFRWRGFPFSSWLFRIAHNQVVDHLRKKARRATAFLDESLLAADDDPQLIVGQKLDAERLALATQQLTSAQQEVISLRFAGGLTVAQAAKIIGKSEGAVKSLQHNAIVALRKILLGVIDR